MQKRRNTRQRQLVLDAVCARCDHPTAEDIYQDVHKVDDKVSRGTVYRNLNLLEETGAISVVKVPGGNRFDRRLGEHPHVTCRICGAVMDAPVPYTSEADAAVISETGFASVTHRTVFEGICPACQKRLAAEKPNATACEGAAVETSTNLPAKADD